MNLKNGSFLGMSRDILLSNNKIVIFGTGVICSVIVPEILRKFNLVDRIELCVDNDRTKSGTTINICDREISIHSPDILKKCSYHITILIAISRFGNVLDQLNDIKELENVPCYIIPAMCIKEFYCEGGKGVFKDADHSIIPKIIHYMWLGNKPIPDKLKLCIESWRKYCPDYEIIRWDESNYDVHKNKFISQAYDNKLYGFVPDFARLDILYQYGGIYMDTDVELLRGVDDLLYQEAFCSVEKWQVINFGGCSGAVKGHRSLEPFLEKWESRSLVREDGSLDDLSSGYIDTKVALDHGYIINGKNQTVNGMNIYTYDYFHPYDYMTGKVEKTDDTFSVHHFNGGWLNKTSAEENLKTSMMFDKIMEAAESVDI